MVESQAAKLILDNLAFERNHQPLFQQINSSVNAGEVLQILGPNGSGKSTLLRILAGLLEPQNGSVFWRNRAMESQHDIYQQQLHYLGHQNSSKRNLTVYENIQLSCALAMRKSTAHDIEATANKLGLKYLIHTQTQYLSAGQLRRLALSRLLINPAPLWILDEPTTALDAAGQQLLMDLLTEHLNVGGIAVVATHQTLPLHFSLKTIQLGEPHA